MSDLATRLERGPGSRELSDLVLKKLGWRRALTNRPDLRGWWFRPDQPDDDDWPTNSPPSPAESVDDGLALAGDDWEAILEEALVRSGTLFQQAAAPLSALPLFISAALVRAAEAQKEEADAAS